LVFSLHTQFPSKHITIWKYSQKTQSVHQSSRPTMKLDWWNFFFHRNCGQRCQSPSRLKSIILALNKCHLQQAAIEDSRVHDQLMQHLLEVHSTNDLVDQYLWEGIPLNEAVGCRWGYSGMAECNPTDEEPNDPSYNGQYYFARGLPSGVQSSIRKNTLVTIRSSLLHVKLPCERGRYSGLVECDDELTFHVRICQWKVDDRNWCHAREKTGYTENSSAPNNWNPGGGLQYGSQNSVFETTYGICRVM